MFETVLIANRGEIALRVLRACRELGVRRWWSTPTADADSAAVRLADQAVRIGPASSRRSYLNAAAIVEAARQVGAQAVHPGYGFLSEDAGLRRDLRRQRADLHRPAAGGDGRAGRQVLGAGADEPRPGCRCSPGSVAPVPTAAEAPRSPTPSATR